MARVLGLKNKKSGLCNHSCKSYPPLLKVYCFSIETCVMNDLTFWRLSKKSSPLYTPKCTIALVPTTSSKGRLIWKSVSDRWAQLVLLFPTCTKYNRETPIWTPKVYNSIIPIMWTLPKTKVTLILGNPHFRNGQPMVRNKILGSLCQGPHGQKRNPAP